MDIAERKKRYEAIEAYRKRPLIVYATATRVGVGAHMAGDAIREFIDQIDSINDGTAIDVLIHSTGGDALAAWKLISLLRERFEDIAILVPNMAFSAATMFALGANKIFMHPHASLGPIDPQITAQRPDGTPGTFSFEDVGSFLRFLLDDVGVTDQTPVAASIARLFDKVDPIVIGGAKRASELSSTVGERMLRTHMKGAEEKVEAAKIAEDLNKGFFAHGDAVSRSRALELRLKIAERDKDLEQLIWEAYLGIEDYMDLRRPFSPLAIYLSNEEAAASLAPTTPVGLPPDAPQQLVENVWNACANQALQRAARGGLEVPFSNVVAVIESTRLASEFRTKGRIFAYRDARAQVQVCVTTTEAQWNRV